MRRLLEVFEVARPYSVLDLACMTYNTTCPSLAEMSAVRRAVAHHVARGKVEIVETMRQHYDDGSGVPGPDLKFYAGCQHGLKAKAEARHRAETLAALQVIQQIRRGG
jgi:hypothetical protein